MLIGWLECYDQKYMAYFLNITVFFRQVDLWENISKKHASPFIIHISSMPHQNSKKIIPFDLYKSRESVPGRPVAKIETFFISEFQSFGISCASKCQR